MFRRKCCWPLWLWEWERPFQRPWGVSCALGREPVETWGKTRKKRQFFQLKSYKNRILQLKSSNTEFGRVEKWPCFVEGFVPLRKNNFSIDIACAYEVCPRADDAPALWHLFLFRVLLCFNLRYLWTSADPIIFFLDSKIFWDNLSKFLIRSFFCLILCTIAFCVSEVFMCLNMFFSGSGQLKPLFNSDITAEHSPSLGAEILFIFLSLITGALSGALASAFVLCHRRDTERLFWCHHPIVEGSKVVRVLRSPKMNQFYSPSLAGWTNRSFLRAWGPNRMLPLPLPLSLSLLFGF